MILTLYYMYATFCQWWRLGALKNKLKGTLNAQNALLLCSSTTVSDPKQKRCLENLLYEKEGRIACIVIPKQKLNLKHWVLFPKESNSFPIHLGRCRSKLESPQIYLLFQALLDSYTPHQSELIQIEKYGELVAWRATDHFEVIVKTDLNQITCLMNSFNCNHMDINHDLSLIKIEMIDVEGYPSKIKYPRKFSRSEQFKYSYHPNQWKHFAQNVRTLYQGICENPKICIENGKPEEKPVSEVKPIKKIVEKAGSKNTLDVHAHSHKKEKSKKTVGAKPNDESKPKIKIETKHKVKNEDVVVKGKSELESKPGKSKVEAKVKADLTAKPVKTKKDVNKLNVDKGKVKANGETKLKSYSEAASSGGKNLQRQNATSSKETSPNKVVKPPNILVYADSVLAKDNVKSVLKSIINKEKYTIYDLPVNTSSNFWDSSTTLVIVCGNVTPNLTTHLLQYLVTGGQLLCLCSDLLYSVLQTFSTAEVREHELVRFTYGEWKRVKMMHHIFCYQASPAKKQFSKDSDQSSQSNGSSPVAPRTPSTVDIQHNGQSYTIQVQVLGAEETWQTPSLLLATVRNSPGKAIFSQVHLEIDPMQYQEDESKYSALRDSDQARLEILKHILSTHLDIDCRNLNQKFDYSPAYFLGRHDLKLQLLQDSELVRENKLLSDEIEMIFCGKGIDPGAATRTRLPVLILSCPTNFSTVSYFETLQTEHLGRLVIYSDVLSSSQKLLEKKMLHGIAVISRQQTHGRGRSDNEWLSPEGCAMFSIQLHIDLNTPLGKALPLVQHMTMVAIVSAIKSIPGLENIEIGLKWPNDLYAYSSIKIGGMIVNSTINSDSAIINIGCGINLSNSEPTLCINDIIAKHNADHKLDVAPLQYEKFFALIFNEIENIMHNIQNISVDPLFDLYYQYWLHTDAKISVSTSVGELRDVTVTGIDQFGFLLVRSQDGTVSSVQPDGNSFDMLKGLIAPKIS